MEMAVKIAMAFEHIQDLKNIVDLVKEDYIAPKGIATHVMPEFRPGTPHMAR
jgi:hypothetical protein